MQKYALILVYGTSLVSAIASLGKTDTVIWALVYLAVGISVWQIHNGVVGKTVLLGTVPVPKNDDWYLFTRIFGFLLWLFFVTHLFWKE